MTEADTTNPNTTEGPQSQATLSEHLEIIATGVRSKERMGDPAYLPTKQDIINAFRKDIKELQDHDFMSYCRENNLYEVLNDEHLDALSDELIRKATEYGASVENPLKILEAGAGNGRLSHFLSQKVETKAPGLIKIIAVDNGEWEIAGDFPIEKMDHKDALKAFEPSIVICSWMPYGQDFTADFRSQVSVKEYILIGETDDGCCGSSTLTWGLPLDSSSSEPTQPTPYELDGFERLDTELWKLQTCRSDWVDPDGSGFFHSKTVVFKRAA